MATLTDVQAQQTAALTQQFKQEQNRTAARLAALVAAYYLQRVEPMSVESVQNWLGVFVPRLISTSDSGAQAAANFYTSIRQTEGVQIPHDTQPTLGVIDSGVEKSLLTMGPYSYANKMSQIEALDVTPSQQRALATKAKQVTAKAVAHSTIRHAQAGSRQTILDNAETDLAAIGWVRVTQADPCYFCAALASRGPGWRPYSENSFSDSNSRFVGDGTAKVHDNCGCSLKPVYTTNDPLAKKTENFADLWSEWGAGGGDALKRFRRGYEHYQKTGEKISWEEANEGLRPA